MALPAICASLLARGAFGQNASRGLALFDGTEASGGCRLLKKDKYGWGEVNGSPACQFMSCNRALAFGKVVS